MQNILVYIGHLQVYVKASELLGELLGLEVGSAQIYRLTDFYGEQLTDEDIIDPSPNPLATNEMLYVEVDGMMLFCRDGEEVKENDKVQENKEVLENPENKEVSEDTENKETKKKKVLKKGGWHEVKSGRIFSSNDCLNPNSTSQCLLHSQYQATLENCKIFTENMDNQIDYYGSFDFGSRLVFINDGATWIRKWITETYPKAVQILDCYHAFEYLHKLANIYFEDNPAKKEWVEQQKELILDSQTSIFIQNLKNLGMSTKEFQEILNYFISNQDRMDYKAYKKIGCGIVGSGAIESAHRTLIQVRMKLSGQRWSHRGAKNLLKLRCLKMNGKWHKVVKLITCPNQNAA